MTQASVEEALKQLKALLDKAKSDPSSAMTAPATAKLPHKVCAPILVGAALEPVQFQFLAPTDSAYSRVVVNFVVVVVGFF